MVLQTCRVILLLLLEPKVKKKYYNKLFVKSKNIKYIFKTVLKLFRNFFKSFSLSLFKKIPLQKMQPDLFYGTKIPILNRYTVSMLAFWNQNIGPKIQILVQDLFFVKDLILQLNWLCPVWPWKMLEFTNVEWISRWAKRSPMWSNLSKLFLTSHRGHSLSNPYLFKF